MLIERVTAETSLGKVYIVAVDGMVEKTFSECEKVTAEADANGWIQDYVFKANAMNIVPSVRYK